MSLHILIPTYNRCDILHRTLLQLLEDQTQKNGWYVTVVDNCSTDGTYELLHLLSKRFSHLDFVTNESNIGLFGNLNRCMDLARSSYYMILHSDDFLSSKLVEAAQVAIKEFAGASLIFGPCKAYIEENDETLDEWHSSRLVGKHKRLIDGKLLFSALIAGASNFIFPPSVIYNRSFFDANLRYSQKYQFTSDFKLWLDASLRNPVVGYYETPIVTCNVAKDRLSSRYAKEMRLEYIEICKDYLALACKNMDCHMLKKSTLLVIRLKLIVFALFNQLNLFPGFKTRRKIAKFIDSVT